MFGVKSQSAPAVAGISSSTSAAAIAHFFNIEILLDKLPLPRRQPLQATYPNQSGRAELNR
jgi:hypothetical protein